MYTYQDYLLIPDTDEQRMEFVRKCIYAHKGTKLYEVAVVAEEYAAHRNVTIMKYQKVLYDVMGKAVPDVWSANYKMASNFFDFFVTQENQYLLGNGVTWSEDGTEKKLGDKFDNMLQKLGQKALVGGVAFGFWNMDHLEAFSVTEFVPLYDEETGGLRAGIRFWQIDDTKPLRATFYEEDGYTDFIWNMKDDKGNKEAGQVLHEKRKYILNIRKTEADGEIILDGMNYPDFPIVPLWGNEHKQSTLIGLREQIDCYDLIKSGYADNVDEGSLIYWTLNNAGGMDDLDLAQFVERMKKLHAVTTDDGVKAEPHNLEAPYQSREALLATLRADLFESAMALDTKNIASGATTATQIKAAYEPLNSKADKYEYCVREFLDGILSIAGVEDTPTFTRSQIVNSQEEINLGLASAPYTDEEYVSEKVLTLLGDGDKFEEIMERRQANELEMMGALADTEEESGGNEALEEYSNDVISMITDLINELGGEEEEENG